MKEEHAFAIILFVVSILAISLFVIESTMPPAYVKEFDATVEFPKVREKYVFHLDEGKHYLFRYWESYVSCNSSKRPFIKPVSVNCPPGSKAYAYSSEMDRCFGEGLDSSELQKINRGEVGCYSKSGFKKGDYEMEVEYETHPEGKCKEECKYIISLASSHVPYKKVRIEGDFVPLYPPKAEFSSGEDEPIIIGVVDGRDMFTSPGDENFEKYKIEYHAVSFLSTFFAALCVANIAIFYYIYRHFGKDREFTVPDVLNYVPNKERKPWLVNMFFKEPLGAVDKDGIIATLLDLHRRGKIRIEEESKGILFMKKSDVYLVAVDDSGLDRFEEEIVRKIREKAKGGRTNLKDFARAGKNGNIVMELLPCCQEKRAEFFESSFPGSLFLLVGMAIIISSRLIPYTGGNLKMRMLVAGLQYIVISMSPRRLFTRWKGNLRKEWLEWQAFRKFLSNEAMMKKYGIGDVSIWEEWLIYASALGVADRVEKTMKELGIETRFSRTSSVVRSSMASYITSRSGYAGGGGGFGGGGAGAR